MSVADTWYNSNGTFAVSNSGNVAAKIFISVTNNAPSGWTLGASPGNNRFSMGYSVKTDRPAPVYYAIDSTGVVLSNALNTNDVVDFDLEFRAPTTTREINTQQTIRVTIMAIEAE